VASNLSLEEVARRLDGAGIAWAVFAGVVVPVIPPEDNILLKAVWGRGAEVGKHDWEDVQAMMAHLPMLDWEYLRWRAGARGPRRSTEPVLERLESLWRQRG
jgi:hypothetical protein